MLYKWQGQNPFPGEGNDQGPRVPWLASTYTNNPTQVGIQPSVELLSTWQEAGFGNKFASFYLDEATPGQPATIAGGVLLMNSAPGTDTVAATLTDGGINYGVTLVTGNLTVNAEVGNFAWFQDLGTWRMIESNTAANLIFSLKGTVYGNNQYDPNYLPGAPVNGSNVVIFRPGHVTVCDAAHAPVAVLLNDVLEGQEVVAQTQGAVLILGNNSGAITVVGVPAITAASGIIEGGTASAAILGDAYIIPLAAYDGVNLLIPCLFHGLGA